MTDTHRDPIAEARRQWEAHGWRDVAANMAVVTSIMRCQQLLLARCDEVLAPFGLSFSRYEVLRLLSFSRRGSLPLGKVGQRLQVHPASVTNAVDRLEAKGLVTRRPNPTDGRGVLAEVTAAGREVVDKATDALNRDVFGSLDLTPAEATKLFGLLAKLR